MAARYQIALAQRGAASHARALLGGTDMPLRVEAWFEGGVLRGVVARAGHLRDALEASTELLVERATWVAVGEAAPRPTGDIRVSVDDIVLAVADEATHGPVHAAWHPIRLEAGPYTIEGDLATMPGFDPGRALTRPTGTFVLLSGVRIRRPDRPDQDEVALPQALVNRYAVDAVQADLMLGFFFPGARMATVGDAQAAATDAPLVHG